MIARCLIGILIAAVGACRAAPKAALPDVGGAPDGAMQEVQVEATTDPLGALPRFRIERADEIALTGPPLAAEALLLRRDAIEIHTRQGQVSFSRTGARGSSDGGGGYAALGAAGFYSANGPFIYALVDGQALVWFNWEISGAGLDDIQSATGLGIGRDHALCDGCVYVSDGPAQSLKEYGEAGTFMRALALPGTDPEGVAVAASGKVYVADAKGRRLLRVGSRLDAIEAVAALPAGAGGDVPTGLEFDELGRLFVCFRDKNVLLVLALPDGA